jgi:hypothetical protein
MFTILVWYIIPDIATLVVMQPLQPQLFCISPSYPDSSNPSLVDNPRQSNIGSYATPTVLHQPLLPLTPSCKPPFVPPSYINTASHKPWDQIISNPHPLSISLTPSVSLWNDHHRQFSLQRILSTMVRDMIMLLISMHHLLQPFC